MKLSLFILLETGIENFFTYTAFKWKIYNLFLPKLIYTETNESFIA